MKKKCKIKKTVPSALTLLFCVVLLLGGCGQESPGKGAVQESHFSIEISSTQETAEQVTLDLQVPKLSGIPNAAAINERIQSDVDGYISTVKDAVPTGESGITPAQQTPFGLYIRTTAYTDPSDTYVSLLLECSNYTGGSHGMNWNTAYNISKDGTLLNFDDLFSDADSGLAQIKQILQDKVNTAPADYYPSAAETIERADRFSFYLCENALVIWFDPYELAPYPGGIIQVEIPFDTLEGFLL